MIDQIQSIATQLFTTITHLFLNNENLGAIALSALRIVGIAVTAFFVIKLTQGAIRSFCLRMDGWFQHNEARLRAETIGRVLRYLVAVVISLIAGTLILSELGVSVAPILGAAGVAGLAIGFGAQSLVKDYVTGFFLLLEDQIRQGDMVKLGEHTGIVEEMTLRYVRLRDYAGDVHFVPNGIIDSVVNMNREHSQAVINVGISYSSSIDQAMEIMRTVARDLRNDPAFTHRILGDFDMAGVDNWADSAIIIRGRLQVAPLEQWSVRREYLRRLKIAFDLAGIEIPFPQVTLHRA